MRRTGVWVAVTVALTGGYALGQSSGVPLLGRLTSGSAPPQVQLEDERPRSAPEAPSTAVTAPAMPPPDTTPPALSITSPAPGARFDHKIVEFAGRTEPGAAVKAGAYAAEVGPDGAWSLVLVLAPGANTVGFVAVDSAGNASDASVTVHYDAPPPVEKEPDACAKTGDCEYDEKPDACAKTGDCEYDEKPDACVASETCIDAP